MMSWESSERNELKLERVEGNGEETRQGKYTVLFLFLYI